jgi:hypothetical protein
MKKILTLTAALLVCASMASAANVYLFTDDCSLGGGSSYTNPCSGSTDAKAGFILAGSIVLGGSSLNSFNVANCTLDVQTGGSTLADWWRLDGAGCRAGAYAISFDQNVTPSCAATLWNADCLIGQCPLVLPQWVYASGNTIRFTASAAIGTPRAFPSGSTEYGVFALQIKGLKSTGATACAGCTAPAAIALQSIELLQAGATDAPLLINNDHLSPTGCVTLNNFGPCTGVTPTRNATWGSVKALYR